MISFTCDSFCYGNLALHQRGQTLTLPRRKILVNNEIKAFKLVVKEKSFAPYTQSLTLFQQRCQSGARRECFRGQDIHSIVFFQNVFVGPICVKEQVVRYIQPSALNTYNPRFLSPRGSQEDRLNKTKWRRTSISWQNIFVVANQQDLETVKWMLYVLLM